MPYDAQQSLHGTIKKFESFICLQPLWPTNGGGDVDSAAQVLMTTSDEYADVQ